MRVALSRLDVELGAAVGNGAALDAAGAAAAAAATAGKAIGGALASWRVAVPFAPAGATVDVAAWHVHRRDRVIEALKPWSLISPGPDAVQPLCKHFGTCGGCRFQSTAYARQLVEKREGVVEALVRAGGDRGDAEQRTRAVVPSPRIFGYRNKVAFSVSSAAFAGTARARHTPKPRVKRRNPPSAHSFCTASAVPW